MCGVPYHAADGYITRLIQRGYRVAICEQMEQPGPGKKLVRREVTRVITPGTATDASLLRSHENNYLAAVFAKADRCGLAYVDISTGEFRTTELEFVGADSGARNPECSRGLVPGGPAAWARRALKQPLDSWVFGADYAGRQILENFRLLSLDGCGLSDRPLAVAAAGAVLHYLRETQKSALGHLNRPGYYQRHDHMVLDAATVRNLELLEPLFAGESRSATLIHVLDETSTGMGGRLLRRRVLNPSCNRAEIEARLDAVAELNGKVILRSDIRKVLGSIQDLERLLAKITLNTASPRDLLALGRSLGATPQPGAVGESTGYPRSPQRNRSGREVRDRISAAISDEPPATLADARHHPRRVQR